ncbi:hypothetical protein V6N11_043971 [Hibiscus sabdariffa]|uniref:Uncharacterized protein n=1 Tax=Hibiscus sabdariffa TaxID=183260 RepID=A0ABR2RDY7_9ROSI
MASCKSIPFVQHGSVQRLDWFSMEPNYFFEKVMHELNLPFIKSFTRRCQNLLQTSLEESAVGKFVKVKNRSLLNNWVWRYALEPKSLRLWHRVIDEKPDSLLSVSWINQSSVVPNAFVDLVMKCMAFVHQQKVTIEFAFREYNVDAHGLAKSVVNRENDSLVLFWSMM